LAEKFEKCLKQFSTIVHGYERQKIQQKQMSRGWFYGRRTVMPICLVCKRARFMLQGARSGCL